MDVRNRLQNVDQARQQPGQMHSVPQGKMLSRSHMALGRRLTDTMRYSTKRTGDDLILLRCSQSHHSLYEGSTYEEHDEVFSKLFPCDATTTQCTAQIDTVRHVTAPR